MMVRDSRNALRQYGLGIFGDPNALPDTPTGVVGTPSTGPCIGCGDTQYMEPHLPGLPTGPMEGGLSSTATWMLGIGACIGIAWWLGR